MKTMTTKVSYLRKLCAFALASLLGLSAWAAATPKLLINSYNGSNTPADGWVNNLQTGGGTLPMSGKLSANGLSFSINNMNGNFLTGGEVNTDFEAGTYTDIYGENHDSVVDEVKASLCLPEGTPFDANIYKSGNIQGAKNGNTATLEGLTPGQKYVVYLGFGRTGNDLHSFKIVSSQYGTVEAKEYLVTVGKDGSTTKATTYTAFNDGDVLQPGTQGLMVVRLKNITPTSAGKIQFTMPAGRSGINWLAVAEMDQAKITASIGGDANWSKISWSDEVTAESMLELTLTANTTLTIDSALTFAGLKIKKDASVEGTVGLKVIAKAGFLTVTPEEGVAFSTVEIPTDAAEIVLTPTGDVLNFIRTSGKTFVFKGTETTGVTLNYGTTTGAQMASHLVFESGKHAMTYGNDNAKLFATGHSNSNPTVWVKNGATLDLTAKDLSGWSGGADVTGVIRVDKGGVLNVLQNSNDTFFYRQRLLLEPGSKMTFNFNKADNGEGRFRWQGGTEKSKAQIYMMDYADDKTNDPAIIEQKGDSQFLLASDATRGLAIYVGAKAKLQIKSEVYVHSNNDAGLAKYGDGELELIGGGTLHNLNVAEGKVKLTEDADHTVTVRNSATGTGTLEFTKNEVSLGQNYRTMKLVLPTSATLNLTASTAEIADGAITLKTAMSADDFATLTVAVVNSASEEIEHETISVAEDGTVTIPLVTQGISSSCAVSSWDSSWTGEVVVKGTAESPTTITVDGAYPTGVTSVKILGNATFAYTEGATESTVSIQPQSGATLDISGSVKNPVTIANGSVVTFKDGTSVEATITATGGTLNVEGTVTASAQILTGGTLTIKEGAVLTSTNNQPFGPNRRGGTYNIYGTLDIGSGTFNHNFNATFNIYTGAIIRGTGAFTRGGGSNTTYQLRKNANASTDYVTFDVPMKWDFADYADVYNFESGVGVKFLKSSTRAATHTLQGSNIAGVEIQYGTFKISANEKCLHGDVVIGTNGKLILDTVDDVVSYDTAPIAAFDIAGTLQCDRRQTIAANGKAASVTLRNGGSITGNGTANGQSFTCGLDVYNAFTITVDGIATISTPISITGADQVITIAKAETTQAALVSLEGGVTGQASGKIKLTEGTSVAVTEALAEGKVITDVGGKVVKPIESGDLIIYTLFDQDVTITIPTVANTTIEVWNDSVNPSVEIPVDENGAITVAPGTDVTIIYAPVEGYAGGGEVSVTIESAETQISTEGIVATEAVARIDFTIQGETYYAYAATIAEAFTEYGGTVTLLKDVSASERLVYTGTPAITLDLNGKTITSTADVALINKGGEMTITGEGTIDASNATDPDNDCVWAHSGNIVIKNGTFINKSTTSATVYLTNSAVFTIEGGTFKNLEPTFVYGTTTETHYFGVLNVNNKSAVSQLVVKGGSFVGTDPAKGDDNLGGTFVADGYESIYDASTKTYTVSQKTGPDPIDPTKPEYEYADEAAATAAAAAINADKAKYIAKPFETMTDTQKAVYDALVTAKVVGNAVVVDFSESGETTARDSADNALEAADILDTEKTAATVDAIPGLFYSIIGGTEVDAITTAGTAVQAVDTSVTLTKPDLGTTTKAFYKVKVSVTK